MPFELSENTVVLAAFALWAIATVLLKIFFDNKKKEKSSTFLERQNLSETKKDFRAENKNLKIENAKDARDENYDTETPRKMVERMTADSMLFRGGVSYTPNESILRASDEEQQTPPSV